MKVLVIDNYDSFVYNLVQYIGEQGGDPIVFRNDQISLEKALEIKPERIVISPGPGDPQNPRYFGVCSKILKKMSKEIPTLGVCLGHQGIISTYGGQVVRAGKVVHGKPSPIKHDGRVLYKGVENPLEATRYHSLVGNKDTMPQCLEVTAIALDDGEIMGVRHKDYPIEGVQFHPESILTTPGKRIIANFMEA
jgi:anthranilate synthase component 2